MKTNTALPSVIFGMPINMFSIIWVDHLPSNHYPELLIGPENAAQVAEMSLKRGISVILDLSEYTQDGVRISNLAFYTLSWSKQEMSGNSALSS
jgi:hypothetical protein